MQLGTTNLIRKRGSVILASLMLLFAMILSWGITTSSPVIVFLPLFLFAALWTLLTWKIEYALWILIIFSINVFGIFHGMSIPHLSLPGIGTFHLRDLVLLGMTIHAMHRFYKRKDLMPKRLPLSKPLLALLLIVLLNTAIDIYQGIDMQYLFRGWRHVAYYLVFFILINEIEERNSLIRFVSGLIVIAIITSVIAYLQFIFGWSFSASKVEYMSEYGIYRTYQHGGVLVGFCFLILLAIASSGHVKSKRMQIASWVLVCFFLGALLTSFARSAWGSMLVAVLFILLMSREKVIRALIIIIPIFFISSYIANSGIKLMTDRSLVEIIQTRSMSGIEDFLERKGTFYDRILILHNKWKTVKNENIVLGIGFDSAIPISSSEPTNYMVNMHPRALVADSSLPNILLLFGLSGIVIFLWILVTFFRLSFRLFQILPLSWDKGVVLGTIAFNIQIVLVSFFGDRYTNVYSVSILASSWAIVILIRRFAKLNHGYLR